MCSVVVLGALFVVPAFSRAGLVMCPAYPVEGGSASCTPTVPQNDEAAIFDSFAITQTSAAVRVQDRKMVNVVRDGLKSENYNVSEHEGPNGYSHPQLTEFVAMAKHASVILISSHGFNPAAEGRECKATKSLLRQDIKHHSLGSTPVPRRIDCSPQAGLLVQPEPTFDDMIGAYDAYLEEGYDPDWVAPLAAADRQGHHVFGLLITADGIRKFFGGKHLALVIDDACYSMAFASAFNARSYFGYTSTSCAQEDLPTMQTLFDRLTGKDGIAYRTTSAAFAQGGFDSPVFDCACDEPVVLSPAVLDPGVDPAVSMSPMSPVTRQAQFDARMADNTGVVTVEGCGATVTNEKWSNDNTTLSYDLNIPDTPTPGDMLTLTIGHDKAVADPGGFPNDQLDGNQDPSPDDGVAPNGSDYVVEKVPCDPIMGVLISGSQDGKTFSGYPVDPELSCDMTTGALLVHWAGSVPLTSASGQPSTPPAWVSLGGEFDTPLGTWTLGDAQGDQQSDIDWFNPYTHIGATSGTITQGASGGSIDATFSDGGGPVAAKGSWTCPSTAA
jgi:hypothetical protein